MRKLYAITPLAFLLSASLAFGQNSTDPIPLNENIAGGGGCTEDIWLDITMDDFGGDITWEVVHVPSSSVVASGGPYANGTAGSVESNYMCLLKECYRLVVYDDAGDGIQNGGYVLRDNYGHRIIDADGQFGTQSQIAGSGEFCLSLSNQKLIDSWCDKTDLPYAGSSQLYASTQPGATGYQFWMFDPHGTYSRRVFKTSRNLHPTYLVTNPVPADIDLNVRIRALVGGQYTEFGKACIFRLNSTIQASARSSSFDEGEATSVAMYPNPAHNGEPVQVTVDGLDPFAAQASIQLIDLAGRVLYSQQASLVEGSLRTTIPLERDLNMGLYMVRISDGTKTHVTRLMVD